ncbi:hypothetical protein ACMD2_22461 [Ananas comosus]|uniref:Uncharacterized protein n=1 Tax=Ananas comosus TaxID=4615 RepID=A0A199W6V2_ANACO|nr:hypothetical protein ACMD2_22461 [Ananas comosus]
MASSSAVQIPFPSIHEGEMKELQERSPLNQSPFHTTPTRGLQAQPTTSGVIDKTLSGAASLVKLLPSVTILAFQTLSPSFTNHGVCYASNKYLMVLLLYFCALSCLFFTFTDSLVGQDGKLYYGLATFKGFYVFNYDGLDEDRTTVFKDLGQYRIRLRDYFHAVFAALLFLALAFSSLDVQTCFFPNAGPNIKELLQNLPLGAGFLAGIVFFIFPTSRKGIGYSESTPRSQ